MSKMKFKNEFFQTHDEPEQVGQVKMPFLSHYKFLFFFRFWIVYIFKKVKIFVTKFPLLFCVISKCLINYF